MQNWQLIRDGQMESETFVQRARILDLMRQWFRDQDFLEVETPLMLKHPGMEPHLNLFSSDFVSEDGRIVDRRFLHTSPEYGMKKLLGAGFEKIFQITKVFRNGEWSEGDTNRHNPEFTMVEWYRAHDDYVKIMDDCEGMIRYMVNELDEGVVPDEICTLARGEWERITVLEAFKRYADMDLDAYRDVEQLRKKVEEKGYEMNAAYDWDDLFFLVMLNEVEPHLGKEKPQFLIDYPASQAALACKKSCSTEDCRASTRNDCDCFYAERFELYVNGLELCNAFTELVDPVEQRERLLEEKALRDSFGKESYDIDESFLEALKTMPPSGGNALGIDRLVMVLLGKKSIDEVLLFPWGDVS